MTAKSSAAWFYDHIWQLIYAGLLVSATTGIWVTRLDYQSRDLVQMRERVERLEGFYTNEHTRLSNMFMTRELALHQNHETNRRLDEIREELIIIRKQGQ